ncbi:MAG: hypothetical protein JNL70_04200 [Saprospiraceae bacterium]|nr:hypothetical protein [Saprospiraceae bacterium]
MKNLLFLCFLLFSILTQSYCQTAKRNHHSDKIKGLTLVAPREPFKNEPMTEVKSVNAEWIAVVPYGFTRQGIPSVRYDGFGQHHWGELFEGVKVTIDSAHKAGLKVMLKPQVWVGGGWIGGLDFATDADWLKWETEYENYILPFAKIADSTHVSLLCIGTEVKQSAMKRAQFWRNLIVKIKKVYKGQLVYAANWDEYEFVTFWNDLDYIGIDAYFSLVPKATPSVSELEKAWQPHITAIRNFQKKQNKPVLFTEFGYMPIDSCTYQSWEIEKRRRNMAINEDAQANAIDALFSVFWKEKWWAGGFLWKWFPEVKATEGTQIKDYSPQGKKAIGVLQKWYEK